MAKNKNSKAQVAAESHDNEAVEESSHPTPVVGSKGNPSKDVRPQEKRTYKTGQKFNHDLFKLKIASMTKNVALPNQKAKLEEIEHTHFFHTVDSAGRPQTTSTMTGGHFHPVKVLGYNEGVPVLEIGPPRKWVKKKVNGEYRRVMAKIIVDKEFTVEGDMEELEADAVAEPKFDTHTHEYEYKGSDEIPGRVINPEFAQFEATIKGHQAPVIEGVKG